MSRPPPPPRDSIDWCIKNLDVMCESMQHTLTYLFGYMVIGLPALMSDVQVHALHNPIELLYHRYAYCKITVSSHI